MDILLLDKKLDSGRIVVYRGVVRTHNGSKHYLTFLVDSEFIRPQRLTKIHKVTKIKLFVQSTKVK